MTAPDRPAVQIAEATLPSRTLAPHARHLDAVPRVEAGT